MLNSTINKVLLFDFGCVVDDSLSEDVVSCTSADCQSSPRVGDGVVTDCDHDRFIKFHSSNNMNVCVLLIIRPDWFHSTCLI